MLTLRLYKSLDTYLIFRIDVYFPAINNLSEQNQITCHSSIMKLDVGERFFLQRNPLQFIKINVINQQNIIIQRTKQKTMLYVCLQQTSYLVKNTLQQTIDLFENSLKTFGTNYRFIWEFFIIYYIHLKFFKHLLFGNPYLLFHREIL